MGSGAYGKSFLVWTKMWIGKGPRPVSHWPGCFLWNTEVSKCTKISWQKSMQCFTRFGLCCLNTTLILLASFYVKNWRCLPFISKGNESFGADSYSKDLTWVWHDFHFFKWTVLSSSFPRPTSPTTMIFGLCCNLFMPHSRNLKCMSRLKMSVSLVCFSSVAGQCTMCTRTTNSQRCLAFLRKG